MERDESPDRTSSLPAGDLFILPGESEAPRETTVFQRLRERKVCQWTLGYVALASVMLEVTAVLADTWGWPLVSIQVASLLLGCGLAPVSVVAWYHGEKGRQSVCVGEAVILVALALVAFVGIRAIL